MKKMMALLLTVALLLAVVPVSAFAEEEADDSGIQLYSSDYFDGYGTTLTACGNGRIKIVFTAFGADLCDQIGVANYMVQELGDDGRWVDVSGLLNGETGRNMLSYTFGRYFNGVAGETYRVKVTFICIKGGGYETKNFTSGRIKAK